MSGTSRHFDVPPLEPFGSFFSEQQVGEVIENLAEKCFAHYDATKKYGSLYSGGLGAVAFLHLHLARYYINALETITEDSKKSHEYRTKADGLLHQGLLACEDTLRSTGRSSRCTLLEGPILGAMATKCAILCLMDRKKEAAKVAAELLASAKSIDRALAPQECEVLYGRAGYLHVILFIRKHMNDSTFGSQEACGLIQHILSVGEQTAKVHHRSGMPLLWEWHGEEYLGAAHGVVGILFTLLHFKAELQSLSTKLNRDYMGLVKATVDALGEQYCFPSGNLASSIGSRSDRLVQWCHGAPGHILLLVKAFRIFGDANYLDAAKTLCRGVVYPRGLLRKGLGLCHGISGNAYCFLSIYRVNEEEEFLKMAQHYCRFGVEHLSELEHPPDCPYSLYEGLAGFTAFLVDLQNPDTSCFPCYEYN